MPPRHKPSSSPPSPQPARSTPPRRAHRRVAPECADLARYQQRTAEAFRRTADDIAALTPGEFLEWVTDRSGGRGG